MDSLTAVQVKLKNQEKKELTAVEAGMRAGVRAGVRAGEIKKLEAGQF